MMQNFAKIKKSQAQSDPIQTSKQTPILIYIHEPIKFIVTPSEWMSVQMWDQLKTVNDLIVLQNVGPNESQPQCLLFSTLSTLANLTLIYKKLWFPHTITSLFHESHVSAKGSLTWSTTYFEHTCNFPLIVPITKKKPRPYVNWLFVRLLWSQ